MSYYLFMFSFEAPDEVKVSEILKDTAWEFLPQKARAVEQVVEVTYWPVGVGVVKLTIEFDPHSNELHIDSDETVYSIEADEPDSYRAFKYYKSIELDADTGEVKRYSETADVRDEYDLIVGTHEEIIERGAESLADERYTDATLSSAANLPADELETEAFYTFDKAKLDYLLSLFAKV